MSKSLHIHFFWFLYCRWQILSEVDNYTCFPQIRHCEILLYSQILLFGGWQRISAAPYPRASVKQHCVHFPLRLVRLIPRDGFSFFFPFFFGVTIFSPSVFLSPPRPSRGYVCFWQSGTISLTVHKCSFGNKWYENWILNIEFGKYFSKEGL